MFDEIEKILDQAISYYSEGFKDLILEALGNYTELVGEISQKDEDFGRRMESFYEWFLFDFK